MSSGSLEVLPHQSFNGNLSINKAYFVDGESENSLRSIVQILKDQENQISDIQHLLAALTSKYVNLKQSFNMVKSKVQQMYEKMPQQPKPHTPMQVPTCNEVKNVEEQQLALEQVAASQKSESTSKAAKKKNKKKKKGKNDKAEPTSESKQQYFKFEYVEDSEGTPSEVYQEDNVQMIQMLEKQNKKQEAAKKIKETLQKMTIVRQFKKINKNTTGEAREPEK